jgi:NAD(P)-dependent dehydrogenase (short-subunit alcohol dehydrogenase family)
MNAQKTLLLVGATSDIGHATAAVYARAGWRVILAARDPARAKRNAADISVRSGKPEELMTLDLLKPESFAGFIDALPILPDTVVSVVGELGEQKVSEGDPAISQRILRANFEGPALLLGLFAERFQKRGSGTLVGVSSVAGDRGRATNYIYGSAKAGLTAFLSGLRNRLSKEGVRVITVKPGFVNTRMTAGMNLPKALTAEPDEVGNAIFQAAEVKHKDVVYVRWIWWPIMSAIMSIPEGVFKKMKI